MAEGKPPTLVPCEHDVESLLFPPLLSPALALAPWRKGCVPRRPQPLRVGKCVCLTFERWCSRRCLYFAHWTLHLPVR